MQPRHDPTYYWATRRLPGGDPPGDHALYGYVRTADEIVDGPRRPASPARRAALDAWERELERGLAAGGPPSRWCARSSTPSSATGCRSPSCATYMRSMRVDCAPVRIATWPSSRPTWTARRSVGRIMAPLLGVPERHHAGYGRLGQAFQLANFIRDVREDTRPRPDLSAGRGPRALRRGRGRARARPRVAGSCARCWRSRSGARASCSPRPSPRSPPRPARCAAACFAVGVYERVLERVERIEFDVLGRRAGVRVWQLPGAALGRCAGDAPGHAARRRAHPRWRRRAARRARLRRELRRAGRGARAGRLRRRRAGRRPLRDRRAPDLRLRRADAVARGDGRARRDPPGAALHGLPHAARLGALPAALELVVVRLPDAVPRAVGPGGRPVRDREGRGAAPPGGALPPTAATAALRRSSSTRSAGGACSAPARTSSRPTR